MVGKVVRVALCAILVTLALGCAGTKARERIDEGCAYLVEYQNLIELGTKQIPNADAEFWSGFTFRRLINACAELQRHEETTSDEESDPAVDPSET